jgi:hypothetical protein
MLVSGCDGGAGPATPFNPFGTEPPGTVSEPPGSSNDQTIAQLCATVCAHVAAACAAYASTNCPATCNQAASQHPNCLSELQAFLSCAATAQITCTGQSVEALACTSSQSVLASCQGDGSGAAVTSTGGAP